MMNGMPEQEGQAPQPQEGEGGDLSQVVMDIQKQLVALLQVADQSGAVDPEGKAQLAQIIQSFREFVKGKLGGGSQDQPEPTGSLPPEAGANPNARPM